MQLLGKLYFYPMWMDRFIETNQWVLVLFLIQFFGIRAFYRYARTEAGYFIRLLDFSTYLRIYGNDRENSGQRPFQMGLYVFCITTLSLFACFLSHHYLNHPFSLDQFGSIFIILFLLTALRYLLVRFTAWIFDIPLLSQQLLFRTLSSYGYLSLVLYAFCVIYFYAPMASKDLFLAVGLGLFVVVNFSIQIGAYYRLIRSNIRTAFYLFLYICAFKITPWVWVYSLVKTLP